MDPISAGLAVGSTLFNFFGQKSANKKNIQLARENRRWQEMMWNKSNKYNLPSAQMQRMKDAGLSPHLMYGKGTVGNTNPPSNYDRAKVDPVSVENPLLQYNNLKLQDAQIDNLEQSTKKKKAEEFKTALEAIGTGTRNKSLKLDYDVKQAIKRFTIGLSEESYKFSKEKTLGAEMQNEIVRATKDNEIVRRNVQAAIAQQTKHGKIKDNTLKDLEIGLNKALKPLGLTTNDSAVARFLVVILDGLGLNINQLSGLFKTIKN